MCISTLLLHKIAQNGLLGFFITKRNTEILINKQPVLIISAGENMLIYVINLVATSNLF